MKETSATTRSTGSSVQVLQAQVAQVGPLPHVHPGVGPQAGVELVGAHVHGVDLGAAPVQQDLGEPSGRGAGVQGPAGGPQPEVVQRAEQLVRARET